MNKDDKYVIIIVAILLVGTTMVFSVTHTLTQGVPTLTANGTFDRVELADRHYGNWNGEEVEGTMMAYLTNSGTVPITGRHYEGSLSQTSVNFFFFLYVYWGDNHLRERISVMGGDTEIYYYLNVTITVSLAIEEETVGPAPVIGFMLGLCASIVVAGIYLALVKRE